jgi:hypothetical protein
MERACKLHISPKCTGTMYKWYAKVTWKGARQTVYRQSDNCIVPMKVGNGIPITTGGKAVASAHNGHRKHVCTQMTQKTWKTYMTVNAHLTQCRWGNPADEEPDAGKPHVRICEGLGRVISLVYSTSELFVNIRSWLLTNSYYTFYLYK